MVESDGPPDSGPAEIGPESVALDDRPDTHMVDRVASSDLTRALQQLDIPLVVHNEKGTIQLANEAAADLAGLPLDKLIGMPLKQFVSPAGLVDDDVADLVAGRFEGFTATRSVHPRRGDPVPVCALVDAIEVDGERGGVAVCIPQSELGRLGRHPLRFSKDLVPVAIGLADQDLTVTFVSSELHELIGRRPTECVGRSLLDMIHPLDAAELREEFGRVPATPFALPRVRFASGGGSWIQAGVLVAPLESDPTYVRFALVGEIGRAFPQPVDRVQDLELHLRRIGAELRAAGVLDSIEVAPVVDEYRQMGQLTSRQWEILSRLLRGERVSTIAEALYVSPSTVRNHLSNIFEKFGVHNQAELIEHFRPDRH